MKLYVWRGVFRDYTSGMAFAIAEDAEQARKLISAGWLGEVSDRLGTSTVEGAWSANSDALQASGDVRICDDLAQPPEVYELTQVIGFGVCGAG